MDLAIIPLEVRHWSQVRSIYLEGIATGQATFAGWAALSPVSKRTAYAGVAETSVSIAERARGGGIGNALFTGLVNASERPQRRLHPRSGFRILGRRERIAQLAGVWRDVVRLEGRSRVVGL